MFTTTNFWTLFNVFSATGQLDTPAATPERPTTAADPDLVQLLQQHDLSNTSVHMVLEQIPT
jgi:hypothetical protein